MATINKKTVGLQHKDEEVSYSVSREHSFEEGSVQLPIRLDEAQAFVNGRPMQEGNQGEACIDPQTDLSSGGCDGQEHLPLNTHTAESSSNTNRFHHSPPLDPRLQYYNQPLASPGGVTIIVNGIPLYVGEVGSGGAMMLFLLPFIVFGLFVWGQQRLVASLAQNRRNTSRRPAAQQNDRFHMPGPDRGPPPAKPYLLEELPLLTLNDDKDLTVRPFCAICTCDFEPGEQVRRLPCAHVYHDDCLASWLLRRCTCPTCRWELPTDDQNYEPGRLKRMANRKPRFFQYELDHRLGIKQIKTLLAASAHQDKGDSSSYRPVDRNDFVSHLLEHELVELVPDNESKNEQQEQQESN